MRQVAVRVRYLARHFSYNSMNKDNVKKKYYLYWFDPLSRFAGCSPSLEGEIVCKLFYKLNHKNLPLV